MTELVPADEIEDLVGHKRHARAHYVRLDFGEETAYILHSKLCIDSGIDLRQCEFSLALDRGVDPSEWGFEAEIAKVREGKLCPMVIGNSNGETI